MKINFRGFLIIACLVIGLVFTGVLITHNRSKGRLVQDGRDASGLGDASHFKHQTVWLKPTKAPNRLATVQDAIDRRAMIDQMILDLKSGDDDLVNKVLEQLVPTSTDLQSDVEIEERDKAVWFFGSHWHLIVQNPICPEEDRMRFLNLGISLAELPKNRGWHILWAISGHRFPEFNISSKNWRENWVKTSLFARVMKPTDQEQPLTFPTDVVKLLETDR